MNEVFIYNWIYCSCLTDVTSLCFILSVKSFTSRCWTRLVRPFSFKAGFKAINRYLTLGPPDKTFLFFIKNVCKSKQKAQWILSLTKQSWRFGWVRFLVTSVRILKFRVSSLFCGSWCKMNSFDWCQGLIWCQAPFKHYALPVPPQEPDQCYIPVPIQLMIFTHDIRSHIINYLYTPQERPHINDLYTRYELPYY